MGIPSTPHHSTSFSKYYGAQCNLSVLPADKKSESPDTNMCLAYNAVQENENFPQKDTLPNPANHLRSSLMEVDRKTSGLPHDISTVVLITFSESD